MRLNDHDNGQKPPDIDMIYSWRSYAFIGVAQCSYPGSGNGGADKPPRFYAGLIVSTVAEKIAFTELAILNISLFSRILFFDSGLLTDS